MTRILSRHVVGGVLIEKHCHSDDTIRAVPSVANRPTFYAACPIGASHFAMRTGSSVREAVAKMRERMGA